MTTRRLLPCALGALSCLVLFGCVLIDGQSAPAISLIEARAANDVALQRHRTKIDAAPGQFAAIANGRLLGIVTSAQEASGLIRNCNPQPPHAYLFKTDSPEAITIDYMSPGTFPQGIAGSGLMGPLQIQHVESGPYESVLVGNSGKEARFPGLKDLRPRIVLELTALAAPEATSPVHVIFTMAFAGTAFITDGDLVRASHFHLAEVPGKCRIKTTSGTYLELRRALVMIALSDLGVEAPVEVFFFDRDLYPKPTSELAEAEARALEFEQSMRAASESWDDSISRGFASAEDKTDALEQVAYYHEHYDEIHEKYPGQYVTIVAGRVIASDSVSQANVDMMELPEALQDRKFFRVRIPHAVKEWWLKDPAEEPGPSD